MRTWRMTVELCAPDEAKRDDVKSYVEDAVASMCGSLRPPGADGNLNDPGDPMWGLDQESVRAIGLRLVGKKP